MKKKEWLSRNRIEQAKIKKQIRFNGFIKKVVRRKFGTDAYRLSFCCTPPGGLGMPLSEFISRGIPICGGMAVLFKAGALAEILPAWSCSNTHKPHAFTMEYLEGTFKPDGDIIVRRRR